MKKSILGSIQEAQALGEALVNNPTYELFIRYRNALQTVRKNLELDPMHSYLQIIEIMREIQKRIID
jgi:hypothetical protein